MKLPFLSQGDTNLAEQEQVYRLASLVQPANLKIRQVRQDLFEDTVYGLKSISTILQFSNLYSRGSQ